MHKAGLSWTFWTTIVALVAIAFGLGWLGAKAQDVNKVDPRTVIANQWIGDLGLLVGNVQTLKPIEAVQTQAMIRLGLGANSAALAQVYDSMSPEEQQRVAFYIPKARAAAAQQSSGTQRPEDEWTLIFADCVDQVQVHGGSVNECFEHRKAGGANVASR